MWLLTVACADFFGCEIPADVWPHKPTGAELLAACGAASRDVDGFRVMWGYAEYDAANWHPESGPGMDAFGTSFGWKLRAVVVRADPEPLVCDSGEKVDRWWAEAYLWERNPA